LASLNRGRRRRPSGESSRSHPLPVGTPASRSSRPPGTLPLATPDARYGPRSAQPLFRHSLEPSVDGPFSRRSQRHMNPDAALAASGKSTTVESNHALPPYQSGACPAGPSSNLCADRKSASAEFRCAKIPEDGRVAACACDDTSLAWGAARESHPAPRIHNPRARY